MSGVCGLDGCGRALAAVAVACSVVAKSTIGHKLLQSRIDASDHPLVLSTKAAAAAAALLYGTLLRYNDGAPRLRVRAVISNKSVDIYTLRQKSIP